MMLGKWKAKYQMLRNIDENRENWTRKCMTLNSRWIKLEFKCDTKRKWEQDEVEWDLR